MTVTTLPLRPRRNGRPHASPCILACLLLASLASLARADQPRNARRPLQSDPQPLPQPWPYGDAMKAVAARGAAMDPPTRPGVVLHVGDSITYANPYSAWALRGQRHTPDDDATLKWMHAGTRGHADGFHLASFDHPDGGRSHTAAGGLRADELLGGGKANLPSLADLLTRYRPQAAVLMIGTNDASAGRPVDAYRNDVKAAIDLMLSRGVVPIPSTIPPHVHRPALVRSYNEALRTLARARQLPLIDYEREILLRRPNDWDGTLLEKGDVHPTAARAGAEAASAPTPENLSNSGYLLRGWLSMKKVGEVSRQVFDAKGGRHVRRSGAVVVVSQPREDQAPGGPGHDHPDAAPPRIGSTGTMRPASRK